MAAINIAADDTGSVFVQMTGYRFQEVTGAMSITLTETANKLVVYDLSTYRDVLSAGELGRAWAASVVIPPTGGSVSPESTDDRPNHEAPREWAKPDTMITWWSQANGSGVALAMCRYAEFVSYSNVRPLLMF